MAGTSSESALPLLAGKVAMVTGAGQGIGLGIAWELAWAGARVVVAELNVEAGQGAALALTSAGLDVTFVETDVADPASSARAVQTAHERYGALDILVNNAGITTFKDMFEVTPSDWDKLMNLDLRGLFFASQAAARVMKEAGGGVIIHISSNHALATLPHSEIYAAAKGGVNALTRAMALSLGPHGIRVLSLSPGFTDTPHYRRWLAERGEAETERAVNALHPAGRINTPQEIGQLAAFLASDNARALTGVDITADAGLSARLYTADGF
ncbi:SDR family NAD(P)-dependent oxidoreductase [Deinococcus marmoris]|nr:glucose 1-dehydrogenase [Deinococcus marmoris]